MVCADATCLPCGNQNEPCCLDGPQCSEFECVEGVCTEPPASGVGSGDQQQAEGTGGDAEGDVQPDYGEAEGDAEGADGTEGENEGEAEAEEQQGEPDL